jgi:homoserine kinase type II
MAVYTQISDAEAIKFLATYSIGSFQKLEAITRGVSNSNYFLTTTEGRYILTLYESGVQERDVPFFLGLMEHAAAKGIPCPRPIRDKSNYTFGMLAGKPAAIVSFLKGESLTRTSPEECDQVGRMLAGFHNAVCDFRLQRVNDLSVPRWQELVTQHATQADTMQKNLGDFLRQEMDDITKNWPTDLPRGIIHADLFPNNVFFDQGKLCGVIDFYFACNDFLAYDLAITLNAWCFENQARFNVTKARALVAGYESARALTHKEKSTLPVLLRGATMRFLLTRLRDWLHPAVDAIVKPLDPMDYVARLHFHRNTQTLSDYGIDA